MTKLLILAAAAAASFGQPAAAQNGPALATSVVVRHGDLDLRSEQGVKTLDRRVWRAVVAACGTASDADLKGKNAVRQCRRDTMQTASAQANVVVASASRDQAIKVSSIGQ